MNKLTKKIEDRKKLLTSYLQQRLSELKNLEEERKRIIIEIFELNSRINELNELIKIIENEE